MTKYKVYQIILFIVYISMICYFTYQCFLDAPRSTVQSNIVTDVVVDVVEGTTQKPIENVNEFKVFVRKFIGHYSYFVLLGIVSSLLYCSFKNIKFYFQWLLHFGIGFAFAFISEFLIQQFINGRAASIQDVGIDCLGFITISIFICVGFLIYRNKQNKNKLAIDE